MNRAHDVALTVATTVATSVAAIAFIAFGIVAFLGWVVL